MNRRARGLMPAAVVGAALVAAGASAQGSAPVTIHRPDGEGPFPFVVLLHGCGGLKHEAVWTLWVQPWAELFREHGVSAPPWSTASLPGAWTRVAPATSRRGRCGAPTTPTARGPGW